MRSNGLISVLDMDSSESPTYGEQEGSAYNGHFGCTRCHPLFVLTSSVMSSGARCDQATCTAPDGWRAVLEPVVIRGIVMRLYSRGDAAFANPEIYEFLEAEGMGYAIRPTNGVLQDKIGSLLVERGCVIDMIRNEDLAQNLNKLHAYLGV